MMDKPIRPIFCFSLLLFLCGCGTTHTLTQTQIIAVRPPEELFVCPNLPLLPSVNASDADVAQFISDLAQEAITCKNSLDAVHKSVVEQNSTISAAKPVTTDDQ